MAGIKAVPPVAVRQDWAPLYLLKRAGAFNRDFAFKFKDGQGMPSSDGNRYHGGVDMFAPGGTRIVAPRAGRVVRVTPGGDSSGQVFGGTLYIEEDGGRTWVMRHVMPVARVGDDVEAGEPVATVHPWDDGGSHLHLEIWRSLAGGYRFENAIDPATVEWDSAARLPTKRPADYYFEEMPHTEGGHGPALVGQAKGYSKASVVKAKAALMRAIGHRVSTLRGEDGRYYILSWAKGTHGNRYRWGAWADSDDRDETARERTANTQRTMRPFKGRSRSLYPWPKEG